MPSLSLAPGRAECDASVSLNTDKSDVQVLRAEVLDDEGPLEFLVPANYRHRLLPAEGQVQMMEVLIPDNANNSSFVYVLVWDGATGKVAFMRNGKFVIAVPAAEVPRTLAHVDHMHNWSAISGVEETTQQHMRKAIVGLIAKRIFAQD